jgi:hypothetical protein
VRLRCCSLRQSPGYTACWLQCRSIDDFLKALQSTHMGFLTPISGGEAARSNMYPNPLLQGGLWSKALCFAAVEQANHMDTSKLMLHFGAVDWEAYVWVDSELLTKHQGG